jgi:hypothetical protein
MSDDFVECLNCGRVNPEWAQVCRACGVPLKHGESIVTPAGRVPTDRDSIVSIAATVATILVAVVLGLILSGLNPTEPTVGQGFTPSPSPTPEPSPTETAAAPSVAASVAASASAAAGPPGTLTFGTALDENDQITEPVDTFTAGMPFAHSISVPTPFGVNSVGEQIVRILDDGTEQEVVRAIDNQPAVVPDATVAGFAIADAGPLIEEWGPGTYEMRVFAGDKLIAQGRFVLAGS